MLQLLNHIDETTGSVSAFPEEVTPLLEALAGLAGVLLDNAILVDELQAINQAFIRLIASALDAKSPYTGGHCVRVPAIAEMLTEAAHHVQTGPFANFTLSDNDREELFVASWLHDCGKITTPEYVVDKATKLETITDRIHEIRTRFEVAKREAEIRCLRDILAGGDPDELNECLSPNSHRSMMILHSLRKRTRVVNSWTPRQGTACSNCRAKSYENTFESGGAVFR